MANVLVEETSLQNIANSIREKAGTTDTYKPSEMASAISGISTGGSAIDKGLVINEVNSSGYPIDISVIGLTTLPDRYFYQIISDYTLFKNIGSNIHLPETLTKIGYDCFYNCKSISGIVIPNNVITIGYQAFYGCSTLTSIQMPSNLKSLGTGVFMYCSKLKSIQIPSGISKLDSETFSGCSVLVLEELPNNIVSLGNSCFYNCRGITKLKCLGNITSIGRACFNYCSNLEKFILPNVTSVPTLDTNGFNNTKISSGTGYIYVPDTLVDNFKSATNWSTYANQIKPISEMPTE
jgi:hypothetical protein